MGLGRRTVLDAAAAAVVGLLVFAAFGHAFLNYDTFYALTWGDQLADGDRPDYEVPVAPTPHPLAIAVGAVVSPFRGASEELLLGLVILSMGFIAVGLFRLGHELFAWPVGLLAATIFLTRVPPLNFGIRGYVDLPTIALIVWAAVLEVRRPRRGWPVLVLLGLAGLLRPEAWLMAGAYWLWVVWPRAEPLDRGRALRLGLLAAAAPLLWALSDLLVTGDPLWSLHGTSDLAADLGRPRGLDDVPRIMPRRLGEIMRLPELLAAVIGFGLALAWLRRRAAVPAAILVLNGVAFLVLAVGGLSLLGRYLFLAGAMLSLFAAVAVFGWLALDQADGRRRPWMAGGLAVLAAMLVFAPAQAGRLSDLRDDIADRDRVAADLNDIAGELDRPLPVGCLPILVANHRPIPNLAYHSRIPPEDFVSAAREPTARGGFFVAPANPEAARLSVLDPRDPTAPPDRPANFHETGRNRSWVVYSGC
ncbi:MAG: hypothetical protein M3340_16500 [Actinomycetota bacterium]|nr:hypothetical protein [Actinomycetota bacterium]